MLWFLQQSTMLLLVDDIADCWWIMDRRLMRGDALIGGNLNIGPHIQPTLNLHSHYILSKL